MAKPPSPAAPSATFVTFAPPPAVTRQRGKGRPAGGWHPPNPLWAHPHTCKSSATTPLFFVARAHCCPFRSQASALLQLPSRQPVWPSASAAPQGAHALPDAPDLGFLFQQRLQPTLPKSGSGLRARPLRAEGQAASSCCAGCCVAGLPLNRPDPEIAPRAPRRACMLYMQRPPPCNFARPTPPTRPCFKPRPCTPRTRVRMAAPAQSTPLRAPPAQLSWPPPPDGWPATFPGQAFRAHPRCPDQNAHPRGCTRPAPEHGDGPRQGGLAQRPPGQGLPPCTCMLANQWAQPRAKTHCQRTVRPASAEHAIRPRPRMGLQACARRCPDPLLPPPAARGQAQRRAHPGRCAMGTTPLIPGPVPWVPHANRVIRHDTA